jgi:rare lipoprotein A
MKVPDGCLGSAFWAGSFLLLAVLLAACGSESATPPAAAPPVNSPVNRAPPAARQVQETRSGPASFISKTFHGKKTASGETYDQDLLVAAHPSYPLGTLVRVTNLGNGRAVEVRVIDRSASAKKATSPIIDVSHGAAVRLGFVQAGMAKVRTEVLEWGGDHREERWHLSCKRRGSDGVEGERREGDAMKRLKLPMLILTGMLAGCASAGGPPVAVAEVTEAEAALRRAEEAGAEERAPDLFEEARIAFAAARRASGDEARRRLIEAREYATAAEAQARAERLQREVARLRREADDLEERADDIRDEAGRPPRF